MQPLSVRNQNPGNMRGKNGGFQKFSSPEEGLRAMRNDLLLKIAGNSPAMKARYGKDYQPTLRNLISTWAPPSENDTENYIGFVAKQTGLHPDAPLTADSVDALIPAMTQMEGGKAAAIHFGKGTEYADAGNIASDAAPVNKPDKLKLYLEAEKRGILPQEKAPLLAEARRRGLIPALQETPAAQEEKGLFGRIGEDIQKRGAEGRAAIADYQADKQSLLPTVLDVLGKSGAGTISDVVAETIKSAYDSPIADAMPLVKQGKYAAQQLADTQVGRGIKDAANYVSGQYGDFAKEYPQTARHIESAANILSMAPIGKGAQLAQSEVVAPAGQALMTGGEKLAKAGNVKIAAKRNSFIQDLITPKDTPTVRANQFGRATEKGLLRERVVAPTAQEQAIIDTVAELPVSKSKSLLGNANIIDKANKAEAESLIAKLKANDVEVPDDVIQNALIQAKDNLATNIWIKSDATAAAAAENVVNAALEIITKHPKTASGLLEARKALDALIRKQKGSKAFNPNLEGPVSTAIGEIRQAINNTVAEAVPDASVKASLAKQSNLYRAHEAIVTKGAYEGKNRIVRGAKGISKAASLKAMAGTAVGLGGAGMAGLPIMPIALTGAGIYGAGKAVTDPRLLKLVGAIAQGTGKAMGGNSVARAINASQIR